MKPLVRPRIDLDDHSMKELTPKKRGSGAIKTLRKRLPKMSIHNLDDLPLVRYKPGLSVEERNKPIELKNRLLVSDPHVEAKYVEQSLIISYSNHPDMGAPSPSWYSIQMAIRERMHKRRVQQQYFRMGWD